VRSSFLSPYVHISGLQGRRTVVRVVMYVERQATVLGSVEGDSRDGIRAGSCEMTVGCFTELDRQGIVSMLHTSWIQHVGMWREANGA
jgi:hypothetical protein